MRYDELLKIQRQVATVAEVHKPTFNFILKVILAGMWIAVPLCCYCCGELLERLSWGAVEIKCIRFFCEGALRPPQTHVIGGQQTKCLVLSELVRRVRQL